MIGQTEKLLALIFAFLGVIYAMLLCCFLLLLFVARMWHRDVVAQAVADDRVARDLEAGQPGPPSAKKDPLQLKHRPARLPCGPNERYAWSTKASEVI